SETAITKLTRNRVYGYKINLRIAFYGIGWTGVTQTAPGGTSTVPTQSTLSPGNENSKVIKSSRTTTGTTTGTATATDTGPGPHPALATDAPLARRLAGTAHAALAARGSLRRGVARGAEGGRQAEDGYGGARRDGVLGGGQGGVVRGGDGAGVALCRRRLTPQPRGADGG
ncbi:hypothetical protein GPJ59_36880, partial [Streptomyces bambusae]|nr:hypothetical protein [Streptomyces bambusae]